eukprot:jgi/Bigna1/142949/aug1.74_g17657
MRQVSVHDFGSKKYRDRHPISQNARGKTLAWKDLVQRIPGGSNNNKVYARIHYFEEAQRTFANSSSENVRQFSKNIFTIRQKQAIHESVLSSNMTSGVPNEQWEGTWRYYARSEYRVEKKQGRYYFIEKTDHVPLEPAEGWMIGKFFNGAEIKLQYDEKTKKMHSKFRGGSGDTKKKVVREDKSSIGVTTFSLALTYAISLPHPLPPLIPATIHPNRQWGETIIARPKMDLGDAKVLKADPNPDAHAEGEWGYDETNPEFLNKKEISLVFESRDGDEPFEWKKCLVDRFDPNDGQHYVQDLESEYRSYVWKRLVGESFSIYGLKGQHVRQENVGKYVEKFKPYTPNDPEAKNQATFHVIIDASWMQEHKDCALYVQGTPATMGEMKELKFKLQQDGANPKKYHGTIDLPFKKTENCKTGIFEWRCVMAQGEAVWEEGGHPRREKKMKAEFFAIFRPNKKNKKYKKFYDGFKSLSQREALEAGIIGDFEGVLRGLVTPKTFVARVCAIFGDMEVSRGVGDTLTASGLQKLKEFIGDKPAPVGAMMALLVIPGALGLSTDSTKEVSHWKGTDVYHEDVALRLEPEPWCAFVLENLDVNLARALDLPGLLGNQYQKSVTGLQEAAARFLNVNDFRWIKIAPVLRRFSKLPKLPFPANAGCKRGFKRGDSLKCRSLTSRYYYQGLVLNVLSDGTYKVALGAHGEEIAHADRLKPLPQAVSTKKRKRMQELATAFAAETKSIVQMAAKTLQTAAQFLAQERAERAARPADAEDTGITPGEALLSIGMAYLHTLVEFAPTTESLRVLLARHEVRSMINQGLSQTVVGWLRRCDFGVAEIKEITGIIGEFPALQIPEIAQAAFENHCAEAHDAELSDALINVLGVSIRRYADLQMPACLRRGEEKLPLDHPKRKKADALAQKFTKLGQAVYQWFRHGNQAKPFLKKVVSVKRSFYFTEDVLKDVEPEERASRMLDALSRNCELIDKICKASVYHAASSDTLLFELKRCRPMMGFPKDVVRTLCGLGIRNGGAFKYAPALARELINVGSKLLGAMAERRNVDEIQFAVATLNKLPVDSPLSHQFFHALTLGAGGSTPSLGRILDSSALWLEIFTTRGLDGSGDAKMSHTAFNKVLAHVKSVMGSAAKQLAPDKGTMNLGDLMSVERNQDNALKLFELLGLSGVTEDVVNGWLAVVRKFDTALGQINVYLRQFCDCGVPIIVGKLPEELKKLNEGYNKFAVNSVLSLLPKMMPSEHLANIAWLYAAHRSLIFLNMWREVGKEVILTSIGMSASTIPKPSVFPLVAPAAAGGDGKKEDGKGAGSAADQIARLDHENLMKEHPLSHKSVMDRLVPAIKKRWKSLLDSVKRGEASVPLLIETFGKVNTMEDSVAELMVLSASGEGDAVESKKSSGAGGAEGKGGEGESSWHEKALVQLEDFAVLSELKITLPAILKLRKYDFGSLFETDESKDHVYAKLLELSATLQKQWSTLTLNSLSSLLAPIKKDLGSDLTAAQCEFLRILAEPASEDMVKWILMQKHQGQFNQYRSFILDSGAEANVINATGSLATVRTAMLQLLYNKPPYASLAGFFETFRAVDLQNGDLVAHLTTVQQNFAAFKLIITKQTESAGVRACKDILHFLNAGVIVLKSDPNPDAVLALEPHEELRGGDKKVSAVNASAKKRAPEEKAIETKSEEFLMDLRSRVIMTEIPKKMQKEHDMSAKVSAFLEQLRVAVDIKTQVVTLYESGHFAFQNQQYTKRIFLTTDEEGLRNLKAEYTRLCAELAAWRETVREMREKYYYLNYFRMRELLVLIQNIMGERKRSKIDIEEELEEKRLIEEMEKPPGLESDESSSVNKAQRKGDDNAADGSAPPDLERSPSSIERKQEADKKAAAAIMDHWRCSSCRFKNKTFQKRCVMCGAPRPAETTALIESLGLKKERKRVRSRSGSTGRSSYEAIQEFCALLHLLSSRVDVERVRAMHTVWRRELRSRTSEIKDGDNAMGTKTNRYQLEAVGKILRWIMAPSEEEKAKDAKEGAASASKSAVTFRRVPMPGADSRNKTDMLHLSQDERMQGVGAGKKQTLPMWVSCAESPSAVLDLVLSVYVRRGRLPEPGEILFCTKGTSLEDVELILYRFLAAKSHGLGRCVFCLADVHKLDYAMQVSVLARLREMLARYRTRDSASLLFVSGKPRQVILNSLSAHATPLGALDRKSLRTAVAEAAKQHNGETVAISSNINGGGKTGYILRSVADRQREEKGLKYRRVPYHESSTAGTLVRRLSRFGHARGESNAIHLDVGHVIPADANTCLFELLIVGVLKDPATCAVYARRTKDTFFVEIPNSSGNRTANALQVCALLPERRLAVGVETFEQRTVTFTDQECTKLKLHQYDSMEPLNYVASFLKAFRERKFIKSATWEQDKLWNPRTCGAIEPAEAFELLRSFTENKTQPNDAPSFSIFNNFVRYMKDAFFGMDPEFGYSLTQPHVYEFLEGLHGLRNAMADMLIATSKDFSMRAVPREWQYGAVGRKKLKKGKVKGPADSAAEDEKGDAESKNGNPDLMASRFENMTKWDETDHPICLWFPSVEGHGGVDALSILALNKNFVRKFIERGLLENLKQQMSLGGKLETSLDRDWRDMSSEEGMAILRKLEGYQLRNSVGRNKPDPTYVVTIDNLLKMLAIQLRLKNGLPIMIMGETGCGKSSLVRQLCGILRLPLRTLNIHGGMEAEDVVKWMRRAIIEASYMTREERIVVFLDEVNTCNCMGLFKEIVCDGSMQGEFLPENLKVSCCLPLESEGTTGASWGVCLTCGLCI